MKKKNKNILSGGLIAFCVGILILFLLNNFTTAGVYEVVSCTFNQHSCYFNESCPDCPDCEDWNGDCTQEIKNDCCDPVRVCSGQFVQNYYDCFDLYCWTDNYKCEPVEQIQGGYKCTCENIMQT